MELALVISIVSICGFAVALSYNVYEFRKVGKALDRINDRLEQGREEHVSMMEEHAKMVKTLDRINESLTSLVRGSRPKKIQK